MASLLAPLAAVAGLFLIALAADQANLARANKLGRDLELAATVLGAAGVALVGWAVVLAP